MNEKIQALNKEKKQVQLLGILYMAALVVSILLFLFYKQLAVVVFLVSLCVRMFYIRKRSKQYVNMVKIANMEECFRSSFKNITYEAKQGIPAENPMFQHFIPVEHPGNLLIRDTVKGNYQNMAAVLTDLTTDYQTVKVSKNGSEKHFPDYLAGCYFEISLNHDTGTEFTMWTKSFLPDYTRNLFFKSATDLTNIQQPDIRRDFYSYTFSGADDIIIPEEFGKALLRLKEYTPGDIAVRINGHKAAVMIKGRFLHTSEVIVRTEITPQLLQFNQFPEIHHILRVIDEI